MSDPSATLPKDRSFVVFWAAFSRHAGSRLWLAVGLQVATGVLESCGLLMMIPLLMAIGLPDGGGARAASDPMTQALRGLGLPATLPILLAIFVGLKAAQAGLRAWSGLLATQLQAGFLSAVRARFYQAMARAHWLHITRQRSSDLSQALLQDLPWAGNAAGLILRLLGVCLVAMGQVSGALLLSPAMTAIALAAGGLIGFGLRRLRARARRLGELGQDSRQELAATVSEHLAGIKIAKSQGRENQHFQHFLDTMRTITMHTLRLERVEAITRVWIELGTVVALGLFVWFAVAVQRAEVAHLIVLAFAFSRLISHANTVQNLWHAITMAMPPFAAAERLREGLETAAEPAAPPEGVAPLALRREVKLEQVSFRYAPGASAPAVHEVTLAFPAGQVTALCGPSGAGKSTMADLLLGLLRPDSGRVTVDGQTLDGASLHAWRLAVGYVPQESFLFHESVRANLQWARPDATEAEMRAALGIAAAAEFVDRLPQGLDTVVGDRGVRLSGGERQRIALARALLRRPALLILDEATSALDPQHESLVQEAIEKLHGTVTIIVIAHRLSTVSAADRIVVMEKGRVAEIGAWEELRARENGAFRALLAADRRD